MAETGDTGGVDRSSEASFEAPWQRRLKPDNEIPCTIAVSAVLGATGDVVVFLSGMTAFSNGVEFTVEVRARPGSPLTAGDLTDPRHTGLVDAMFHHGNRGRGRRLLLGVEFADGRSCTNAEGKERHDHAARPDQPQLWPDSGSGGARNASATWFLSPLPPPGDLRFVCAWPAAGIPETITTLPTDDISDAAGRARELWPWEPEAELIAEKESIETPIPTDGWFATHLSNRP